MTTRVEKILICHIHYTDNIDMGFETTEEIMAEELEKQRRKLREMTSTLEQQYQMLRLIVQVSVFACQMCSFTKIKLFLTFCI